MAVAAVLAVGCSQVECTGVGCQGREVSLALIDDRGTPAAARGEVDFSKHDLRSFDCGVSPEADLSDIDCQDGVLTLASVYNATDTIQIRFELEDGSFTQWKGVELQIEKRVLKDFNGPGCDCRVFDGTTSPVTVPADAQLSSSSASGSGSGSGGQGGAR